MTRRVLLSSLMLSIWLCHVAATVPLHGMYQGCLSPPSPNMHATYNNGVWDIYVGATKTSHINQYGGQWTIGSSTFWSPACSVPRSYCCLGVTVACTCHGGATCCPPNEDATDSDGDGIPDITDPCPDDPDTNCVPDDPAPDGDGDGIPDEDDPCPADATNTCNDDPEEPPLECPDNCTPIDTDDDGVADDCDCVAPDCEDPDHIGHTTDTDGDGCNDCEDSHPDNPRLGCGDDCSERGGDADGDGCCADVDSDDNDPEVCEDECERGRVDQKQRLLELWGNKFSLAALQIQDDRPTLVSFTFLLPGDLRRTFSLGYDLTVSDGADLEVSAGSWAPLGVLASYREAYKQIILIIVWMIVVKNCWFSLREI